MVAEDARELSARRKGADIGGDLSRVDSPRLDSLFDVDESLNKLIRHVVA